MPLIRLPRPASPTGAISDLWSYLREEHPYRWWMLLLAMLCTGTFIAAFWYDGKDPYLRPEGRITYFESWRADRSDVEILEQMKKDIVEREAGIQKRTSEFQKAADIFGIEYKEDAARDAARRKAENDHIQKVLDKRIEIAREQLARKGAGQAAPTAIPAAPVPQP